MAPQVLDFLFRRRGSSEDAFDVRKRLLEVWNSLQRLVDVSTPNLAPPEGDARSQMRHNRALPVLLVPVRETQPMLDQACFAITKDLSEHGISIVLSEPLEHACVICGFWIDEPCFLQGELRQNTAIGGGFWQAGVHLTRALRLTEVEKILPLAEFLVPPNKGGPDFPVQGPAAPPA